MEWLNRMTKALEYLEDHLDSEINLDEVVRVACSSSFHFQRMFSLLTGLTVGEYLRKRRLTLAAQELVAARGKVIDVALKYGYENPESFARAFKSIHGISPSAAREPGVKLKGYPRISFQITLKGEQAMDYKIVDLPGFRVVGKGLRVSTKNNVNFKLIPEFWKESHQNGFCATLEAMAVSRNVTGKAVLGVCMEFASEAKEFLYFIGVEDPKGLVPEGMVEKTIPAATWAIFEATGAIPDAMQDLCKRVYSEWFPGTGYERACDIDIEVYPLCKGCGDQDYHFQMWVPIVKK